jgi:hypothetical protein
MSGLTDDDIEALIGLEKHADIKDKYVFPEFAEAICIDLLSNDKREKFILDINRKGHIVLNKITYQIRAKVIYPLLRLDMGGAPHTNPDGAKIGLPHLHIYKEGYGDTWAYNPVDIFGEKYNNSDKLLDILNVFMEHCNITIKPEFEENLFI